MKIKRTYQQIETKKGPPKGSPFFNTTKPNNLYVSASLQFRHNTGELSFLVGKRFLEFAYSFLLSLDSLERLFTA